MKNLNVSNTANLKVTPELDVWGGTLNLLNESEYDVISWEGSIHLPDGVTISGTNVTTNKVPGGGVEVKISSPTWNAPIKPGQTQQTQWLTLSGVQDKSSLVDNLKPLFTGTLACPPIEGKGIPATVFAPYVDVTAYSGDSPYYTSGHFSLLKCFEKTHQLYYTLAFILAGKSNDGKAYWGGVQPVDSYYYADQINATRSNGGDVIVSFGGANGKSLAESITDQKKLVSAYQEVIDKLKLTYLDFDIEGAAVNNTTVIKNRNQALATLQSNNPGLKISLTLPVNPDGLPQAEINIIQDAVQKGVKLDCINIMAMDFGDSYVKTGTPMYTYIEGAANSLYTQLTPIFPGKTKEQIWNMIGITPMIGYNDNRKQIVGIDDAGKIVKFTQDNKVGRLSMWSSTRDNYAGDLSYTSPLSSGIKQADFQFTQVFQTIMNK